MARRFPAAQSPPSPCCQAAEPNSKPRVAGRGFGEGQVQATIPGMASCPPFGKCAIKLKSKHQSHFLRATQIAA